MKRLFFNLLIILSPVFLHAGIVYDTMEVDLALLQPLGVVASTLQFPTIYSTFTGQIDTSMSSEVIPHGINGSNSTVVVTGEPNANYNVSIGEEGRITLRGPDEVIIIAHCSITDRITFRNLNGEGVDAFYINGVIGIESPLSAGTYNGETVITVEYAR